MICFIIDNILPSPNTNLFVFCVYLEILAIRHLFSFSLEYYHLFMSRMSWEFHHLLRILDTGDTSRHIHSFLVPVLILTGIPTSEQRCLDSILLATLLL